MTIPNSNPIVIETFRASFRDLQPGDAFLVPISTFDTFYEIRHVSRVTPQYFTRDFGDLKPSGSREYSDRYDRDTGRKIGGKSRWHSSNAVLPTPERVTEINAEKEERAIRRALKDTDFSRLDLAIARKVLKLLPEPIATTQ